ncbi:DUF1707 SHOCT-like domain-containing protein [Pseudonocardia sp. HH130629-09]|uniref:DUF1707 SHOCT-like domain-containing protein n=1 Tax=Pseudonocardia sp. HH130629-09 TaxID=1641402 RepID=UPI0007614DA3|nr:DUF1707 domain-containing protein [Pseudonocardia sp. HH130629-09]
MSEALKPEDVRISDADRQAVADRLRAAHAEGYLDLAEYDERVTEVWRMRTRGDLGRVTRDLPAASAAARRDGTVFSATPGGVAMKVLSIIWLCLTAAAAAGTSVLALLTELSPWWFLVFSAPTGAVLLTLWGAGAGRARRGGR